MKAFVAMIIPLFESLEMFCKSSNKTMWLATVQDKEKNDKPCVRMNKIQMNWFISEVSIEK